MVFSGKGHWRLDDEVCIMYDPPAAVSRDQSQCTGMMVVA